jgi:hypothetical protein
VNYSAASCGELTLNEIRGTQSMDSLNLSYDVIIVGSCSGAKEY